MTTESATETHFETGAALLARHPGAIIRPVRGVWPRIAADAFIAPGAVVVGDVTIGAEASVWYGCVLRGDDRPDRAVRQADRERRGFLQRAPRSGRRRGRAWLGLRARTELPHLLRHVRFGAGGGLHADPAFHRVTELSLAPRPGSTDGWIDHPGSPPKHETEAERKKAGSRDPAESLEVPEKANLQRGTPARR